MEDDNSDLYSTVNDNVLLSLLQSLLSNEVKGSITWKSEFQRRGARAVVELDDGNLVLVGPTSAGKTMTWMLWAALQASLPKKEKMLVICPLVAIKEEFFAKAQECLIPSHYWGSGNDLPTAEDILVFLSVEDIPHREFQAWLTANAHQVVSCTCG